MRGLRAWARAGLFLLVLAVGIGGPLATPPASVAIAAPLVGDNDEDDEQSLDEFVDETIALSNAFWAERFREIGKPYRAPKVVNAHEGQRITSQCGNSRGSEHSYCGRDETVFLNWDWDTDNDISFETLWADDRSLVIVTTVGHEWGHHVQQLLGIFNIDDQSVATENQADCLMGDLHRLVQPVIGLGDPRGHAGRHRGHPRLRRRSRDAGR